MPNNPDHPYHHKDIYIDRETLEPMYSFVYDQKEELWKIIWHNHRWSEGFPEYKPREAIPDPRDLCVVSGRSPEKPRVSDPGSIMDRRAPQRGRPSGAIPSRCVFPPLRREGTS